MLSYHNVIKGQQCLSSGFHHEVVENCALLGYYTVSTGNFLLLQYNLSVPPSRWD